MRRALNIGVTMMAAALLTMACGQTDAGITTKVKSKLVADDEVKAYQIDVDTKDKIVTLKGQVDTPTAKSRAVEIARTTDGVRDVVDSITMRSVAAVPEPDAARATFSDAQLTAAVKAKLAAEPGVSALRIDVDTRDGVVTLKGRVKTAAEKDQALLIARETNGVRSVEDMLTVGR